MTTRRILIILMSAACAAVAQGPRKAELYSGETSKISDHVWVMMGNPNIAIIVGTRGTLVVDTGLGAPNGEVIARAAQKLSPAGAKLYLTTTHFHPEHAAGEPGFPASTVLIRNTVQQKEFELNGLSMVDTFSKRGPEQAQWLSNRNFRTPDVLFENEAKLDLGGVTARLLWFGGAHTKGDELTFVEPDRTLISGDVVQNKTMPNIFGDGGTPSSWHTVLDKIAGLNAAHVLPDHSAPGDGSLVAAAQSLISEIRTRALALKGQGMSVDDAGKQVSAELKAQHPDWPNTNAAAFVKSVYADPQ